MLIMLPGIYASLGLKENYQPEETIIGSIEDSVVSQIYLNQIEFLRGHIRIPVEYDIVRLDDKYYFWILAPRTEGNYTVLVKDIIVNNEGENKKVSYISNIHVAGESINYNVKPGAVIALKDFELEINMNKKSGEEISTSLESYERIYLRPGKNILAVKIADIVNGKSILQIGQYKIPVYSAAGLKKTSMGEVKQGISFYPGEILEEVNLTDKKVYNISIKNLKNETIYDISFNYSKELFDIKPISINRLAPNASVNLSLSVKNKIQSNINERIIAKSGNETASFLLLILIARNNLSLNNSSRIEQIEESEKYYCPQLSGVVCNEESSCNGDEVESLDGLCCIGICENKENADKRWIGYALAFFVAIVLVLVFIKYRKSK